MNPIRLSICIATLDRARFLRQTLESIFPQAGPEVEVVVVDGGSSDETPVIVDEGKRRFPRLRSIRLDHPGGVDRDFDLAVSEARGDYCWLFPDDDLLKAGAISRVLQATRESREHYALVIANAEVRTADLTAAVDPVRLWLDADRTYGPKDQAQLLAETGPYLSYIGGVIIRRDLWTSRDRRAYFGSAFIHVGVIFQAPLPSDSLVISEPLITIRYGNAQWSPRSFEIWMFNWPELIWSFSHLPEEARRKVVPREPWKRAKTLLRYRAAGAYGLKEYQRWIRPRPCSSWIKLMAGLIAALPGPYVNAVARFYYSRFHPRSRLELMDMQSSRFSPGRGGAANGG